mgnify:CR=1 FL=1
MQVPNPDTDKKRQRRKDARPAEIIAAAMRLWAERGFSATRLEDVAAGANIAKGTIYRYFPSKEALFEAALQDEPAGPARCTRAYVKASRANALDVARTGRATVLLALGDPAYQARWSRFLQEACAADTLDAGTQLACRLAADGLWYSLVFGPTPGSAEVDAALQRILQLTHGAPP